MDKPLSIRALVIIFGTAIGILVVGFVALVFFGNVDLKPKTSLWPIILAAVLMGSIAVLRYKGSRAPAGSSLRKAYNIYQVVVAIVAVVLILIARFMHQK